MTPASLAVRSAFALAAALCGSAQARVVVASFIGIALGSRIDAQSPMAGNSDGQLQRQSAGCATAARCIPAG